MDRINPGGTGRPRLDISTRPAPFPPSKSGDVETVTDEEKPKEWIHFARVVEDAVGTAAGPSYVESESAGPWTISVIILRGCLGRSLCIKKNKSNAVGGFTTVCQMESKNGFECFKYSSDISQAQWCDYVIKYVERNKLRHPSSLVNRIVGR